MRVAREVAIRLARKKGEAPASEILFNGVPTNKLVPGVILEGAVQWNSFHLMFMTDDTPFEEILRVLFLDERWNVVDSACIGGPYSTGSFSSLDLSEMNTVRFRFIGDTMWSVELLPRPSFRMPFLSEPFGVWRPLGFSRHFIVRGKPRPETGRF